MCVGDWSSDVCSSDLVSKARHRLGSESVSWCLETSLFLRLPSQDGAPSLPVLSLFSVFYIFSYLFLKTMICFSGCLMSSASIQKLFCEFYSALKCSFDEFVREKVVSPSYSSAILGPPPCFSSKMCSPFTFYIYSLLRHRAINLDYTSSGKYLLYS